LAGGYRRRIGTIFLKFMNLPLFPYYDLRHARYHNEPHTHGNFEITHICAASVKEAIMESQSSRELRIELERLLRKQSETLEAGLAGKAGYTESLKYEIRQEAIRDMLERLAHSAST
jgi:hypothetical protein